MIYKDDNIKEFESMLWKLCDESNSDTNAFTLSGNRESVNRLLKQMVEDKVLVDIGEDMYSMEKENRIIILKPNYLDNIKGFKTDNSVIYLIPISPNSDVSARINYYFEMIRRML